jgi:hypothetical protein
MKITHKSDYKARRVKEYPPLQDFADALYWAQRGDPSKLDAYLAACDAVKKKYAKPK